MGGVGKLYTRNKLMGGVWKLNTRNKLMGGVGKLNTRNKLKVYGLTVKKNPSFFMKPLSFLRLTC